MALHRGPKIITDGLVLCLDAADRKSYSGSGTIWYDRSGNKNNATLTGSPINNGNKFYMNGSSQFAEVTLATGTARTVDIVYKLYNPAGGYGPLWRTQDWCERIFSSSINVIPSSSTYYYVYGPDSSTSIINIAYSFNGTSLKSYKNGSLISDVTMNSSMISSTYSYRFGNQSSGSTNAYIEMDLYYVRFYNRQLSNAEVLQNFTAQRGRFGI